MHDTNIQDPKQLMEQGWKAREDYRFDEAETLLNKAMEMFKESGDMYNVTECLNHLAYNAKLRASVLLQHGLDLAKRSHALAQEHKLKEGGTLRALLSLQSTMGLTQEAIRTAERLANMQKESVDKADTLAHIAKLYLESGKTTKAYEIIQKAKKLLERYYEEITEPHRYIWETKLLMTYALVEYALGNQEEARSKLEEAKSIAQEHNIKSRLTQATYLLESLFPEVA